jgi:hypothetical protein
MYTFGAALMNPGIKQIIRKTPSLALAIMDAQLLVNSFDMLKDVVKFFPICCLKCNKDVLGNGDDNFWAYVSADNCIKDNEDAAADEKLYRVTNTIKVSGMCYNCWAEIEMQNKQQARQAPASSK